jgi:replicative DNA helicase
MSKRNFEYLGNTFQLQLLNQLILDKDFSHSIIDVIEPSHFENKYFKTLIQLIKEYYVKYDCTPSYETLSQIVKSEFPQELMLKILNDTIKQVQDSPVDGVSFVQEKALKFCKQQELQKAIVQSQKILDNGEFENYEKLEELFRTAIQIGENNNKIEDVFNNLDDVLNEDFRHPIPMGIVGIDKLLKGGLAKGELGVILAPTGVGKTTVLTKIANSAFNITLRLFKESTLPCGQVLLLTIYQITEMKFSRKLVR